MPSTIKIFPKSFSWVRLSTMRSLAPSRCFGVSAILAVLLVLFATTADAAYPRLLMVYGKSLAKPIVVENALDVVKVIDHTSDGASVNGLEDRPYLELALFWGNEWNRYMDEGKPANQLRPEDVTPFDNIPIRGRFYPICNDSPAQITLTEVNGTRTHSMWRVSPAGLKVLEDLGVPVKADCKRP